MNSNTSQNRRKRIKSNFERWLWRFRLISIIPVLMSLLGSISCFILGTQEELSALHKLFNGHFDSDKSILLLGKVVGGIDYYVIGIALLIFGYGVYELIISDIDWLLIVILLIRISSSLCSSTQLSMHLPFLADM